MNEKATTTYYKADVFRARITAVQVIRETDKTVLILNPDGSETRAYKGGYYDHYYKTYEEARDYHVDRIKKRLKSLETEKANLESQLQKLETTEPPRPEFKGDPNNQEAVREFLRANPDREASDGGRLG